VSWESESAKPWPISSTLCLPMLLAPWLLFVMSRQGFFLFCFVLLALLDYQGKDIVFRFIIEYIVVA
jgi:hypothetical protein